MRLRSTFGWVCVLGSVGCHGRAAAPTEDTRTVCARALGIWEGDDVESPGSQPAERAIARDLVRAQRWRITENSFETTESGRTTREVLAVVDDDRTQCRVDVALGDLHRQLDLHLLTDGRLRISAPGGHVSMIVRRTR